MNSIFMLYCTVACCFSHSLSLSLSANTRFNVFLIFIWGYKRFNEIPSIYTGHLMCESARTFVYEFTISMRIIKIENTIRRNNNNNNKNVFAWCDKKSHSRFNAECFCLLAQVPRSHENWTLLIRRLRWPINVCVCT